MMRKAPISETIKGKIVNSMKPREQPQEKD
jgi:hypothetical protein